MATAAEAARSRDAAETAGDRLYAAASAYVAANKLAGTAPLTPAIDSAVMRSARQMARKVIGSIPDRYGSEPDLATMQAYLDKATEDLTFEVGNRAVAHALDHWN